MDEEKDVVEEKDAGEKSPENLESLQEEVELDGFDLGGEGKLNEDDPNKPKGDDPNKDPEPSAKEKEMADRLSRLEADKRDLKRALHEARQGKKKRKETEAQTVLTDAELTKIIEEHHEDPKVMFNALTYKMNQVMKSGKKEAGDEVEINTRQKELDGTIRQRPHDFEE